MLLPGPEAQQLAIYVGWLLNGRLGGLIAGVLFVLPGLLALSAVYAGFGETAVVAALFAGLAPAVLAIVTEAVIKVARRALHHVALVALAVGAFLALAVFALPFPLVVLAAGAMGWGIGQVRPKIMAAPATSKAGDGSAPLISNDALHHAPSSPRRPDSHVTFVPCFLFIFLGAPYVERLRGHRPLAAALSGVTAAVVGVTASLGVFFATRTLFAQTSRLDWGAGSRW